MFNHFSRIYFSRYFYSTFKSRLKGRIKISDSYPVYFYSDAYHFNSVKATTIFSEKFSNNFQFSSIPNRSFFLNFNFFFGNNSYDFSWFSFSQKKDFFEKLVIFFLKIKFNTSHFLSAVKLYKNFYFFKRNF
jgi:hypothetical protein